MLCNDYESEWGSPGVVSDTPRDTDVIRRPSSVGQT